MQAELLRPDSGNTNRRLSLSDATRDAFRAETCATSYRNLYSGLVDTTRRGQEA